jgi:hypothetical protein
MGTSSRTLFTRGYCIAVVASPARLLDAIVFVPRANSDRQSDTHSLALFICPHHARSGKDFGPAPSSIATPNSGIERG